MERDKDEHQETGEWMNDETRNGEGQLKMNASPEDPDRAIISLYTGRCRHGEEGEKRGRKVVVTKEVT